MTRETSTVAESATPAIAFQRTLPILVTVLLIAVIWGAHLHLIPAGTYHFYDEFHTLDRSTGFARHNDWLAVYSLQEVNFRKPPLQYWMSAGLLEAGADLQLALRLPSMIFAVGLLGATAFLAGVLLPNRLWAMPGAVLLFACSTMFWRHALSAMLDMGAAFFATMALASALMAIRRPNWWYACAAFVVLGALQKAAIGLFLVGFFLLFLSLTSRWHGVGYRQIHADRRFRISVWIAILGTIAWPLMQGLLHDFVAFEETFSQQAFKRFRPTSNAEEIRALHDLNRLLIGGEPVVRWLGIAALVWLPWRLKRPELLPLPMLFGAYALAMMLAGGHVTPRYTLNFLPLLAASLSCVVVSLTERQWISLLAIVGIAAAASGPVRAEEELRLGIRKEYQQQIDALTRVGTAMQPGEHLVVCTASGKMRIVPALASYFAAGDQPFTRINKPDKKPDLPTGHGTIRGICTPDDLERFSHQFRGIEVVEELAPYVMWTAEGLR